MVPNSIVMRVPTVPASDPSKVFKGKKMPGHMGNKKDYSPESGSCTRRR